MKKLLIVLPTVAAVCCFTICPSIAVPGLNMGTSEGTKSVSTLQQHQFEKEETLNFTKEPEAYKQRRDKKNKYLDYQEGKVDVLPSVKTQYNQNNTRPGSNNLEFVKDEYGRIRIKKVQ